MQIGDGVIKKGCWFTGTYLGSVFTKGGTEVCICETEEGTIFMSHPSQLKSVKVITHTFDKNVKGVTFG